jgi:glycosyltransferase involved in cell wall biosynthesis
MSRPVTMVQYWAGCPGTADSKWHQFLALVQRCREQGWRSYLVWSRMPENPALAEPFRQAGCAIILQPRSRRNFDLASVWRTYRLLRRLRCDVFHCHNDHTSPLIGATLAGVSVRVWSKLAMSLHYERGVSPTGIHRLLPSVRVSGMLAHHVHAVSEAVGQELIDAGVPATKVESLRCPIDLECYNREDGARFRRELGLARGDLLVVTVGRAIPVKGWDVLLGAFQRIVAECPTARLALVGGIDSKEDCGFAGMVQGLVQQAGLTEKVHFVGRRSDVAVCLAAADVFVLPSRSEGQPLALMEAMASGLPCIATAVGGIPETIAHRENGLLFERENVGALTSLLRSVLSDAALRRRLAQAAKDSSTAFGIEPYVESLLSLYGRLLGNRNRNGGPI